MVAEAFAAAPGCNGDGPARTEDFPVPSCSRIVDVAAAEVVRAKRT